MQIQYVISIFFAIVTAIAVASWLSTIHPGAGGYVEIFAGIAYIGAESGIGVVCLINKGDKPVTVDSIVVPGRDVYPYPLTPFDQPPTLASPSWPLAGGNWDNKVDPGERVATTFAVSGELVPGQTLQSSIITSSGQHLSPILLVIDDALLSTYLCTCINAPQIFCQNMLNHQFASS